MIWNIILVHLLGLMSPGPDFFYISRTAAVSGRRNALFAAIGIATGVAFWAAAALLGLSLLLAAVPALYRVLMALGGTYLIYVGWKMLKVRQNVIFGDFAENMTDTPKTSAWVEMGKGLMVNLSNPKVVVYFSSVMSAVLASVHGKSQILLVFGVISFETLLYFCLIALLFSGGAVKRFYSRYGRYIDNISGAVFLMFGLVLWLKVFGLV